MIHCRDLTFTCKYAHVRAHQDDMMKYDKLPRPAQLNCIMDSTAKNVIWGMDGIRPLPQTVFPLEPVAVFVKGNKIT